MVGSKKNYKFELGVEGLNHSLCDQWKQNHLAKSYIDYYCHYWVFASKHYSTMWNLSFLSHLLMKADSLLHRLLQQNMKTFLPHPNKVKITHPPSLPITDNSQMPVGYIGIWEGGCWSSKLVGRLLIIACLQYYQCTLNNFGQ